MSATNRVVLIVAAGLTTLAGLVFALGVQTFDDGASARQQAGQYAEERTRLATEARHDAARVVAVSFAAEHVRSAFAAFYEAVTNQLAAERALVLARQPIADAGRAGDLDTALLLLKTLGKPELDALRTRTAIMNRSERNARRAARGLHDALND
jgi:hypothetical protein